MVEKEANEKGVEEANTPPHTRPQSAADGKTSQIVATLSRIIENATKVKRGAQDFLEVPEAQLRRVVEELRRVTEESTQLPQGDAITRILANTEDIKKKLAVQNQGAQKTWSQIVKGQPAQVATAQVNRQQNAERRKDRELIVTVINEEQRQIANRRSTQQVLESIQARELKLTTGETVAV
jgi:transketolase